MDGRLERASDKTRVSGAHFRANFRTGDILASSAGPSEQVLEGGESLSFGDPLFWW